MQKSILLAVAIAGSIYSVDVYAAEKNSLQQPQEFQPAISQIISQTPTVSKTKRDKGERMNRILQQLNLTSEQSQRIETIKQEFKTENQAFKQQLQSNRQETQSLLAQDTPLEELRQKHQETQQLLQNLGNNRFEMMLQVRQVLTPEQRMKFAELIPRKK